MEVDPTAFSEDDFPVHCTQCDYDLRSIAEDRCPECGLEFRRGQLIVEMYLRGRRPVPHEQAIFRCMLILNVLLLMVSSLYLLGRGGLMGPTNPYILAVQITLVALILACPIMYLILRFTCRPSRWKRYAVKKALLDS